MALPGQKIAIMIAGTEENDDDTLLDWDLNSTGTQFAVCKFCAGINVIRTRF